MADIEVTVPEPIIVEVTEAGPAGPPGAAATTFTQTTPATVWTVSHNLGHYPIVRLKTLGTQEIEGEITHLSVNQFTVTFNTAQAGQAIYI